MQNTAFFCPNKGVGLMTGSGTLWRTTYWYNFIRNDKWLPFNFNSDAGSMYLLQSLHVQNSEAILYSYGKKGRDRGGGKRKRERKRESSDLVKLQWNCYIFHPTVNNLIECRIYRSMNIYIVLAWHMLFYRIYGMLSILAYTIYCIYRAGAQKRNETLSLHNNNKKVAQFQQSYRTICFSYHKNWMM